MMKSETAISQQCERILLAIAVSEYKDQKLTAIFESALKAYIEMEKQVPCYLVKVCLMFRGQEYLSMLLVHPIDLGREDIPLELLDIFHPVDNLGPKV